MVSLKRWIYGLPALKFYRDWRVRRLASAMSQTRHGFRFCGYSLYFRDDWESVEREIVHTLFSSSDVFVDVGASHGFYTCLAATAGLKVAAIEAEPGSAHILKQNVLANEFADVEIFPIAVARDAGVMRFYGDGDCASLDVSWANVGTSFSQLVSANTLDNLFAERWHGLKLLIKVDVEGLEAEVLAGASQLIMRHPRPCWLIETFPRSNNSSFVKVFEMMFDAGYMAIVADEARTKVTIEAVRRWASDPALPGRAYSNFLFLDQDLWPGS